MFCLKAFKNHKLVDVFTEPGECDLTIDVDFNFLEHLAKRSKSIWYYYLDNLISYQFFKVITYGPVTQSSFLSQMQIGTRLQVKIIKLKNYLIFF